MNFCFFVIYIYSYFSFPVTREARRKPVTVKMNAFNVAEASQSLEVLRSHLPLLVLFSIQL